MAGNKRKRQSPLLNQYYELLPFTVKYQFTELILEGCNPNE